MGKGQRDCFLNCVLRNDFKVLFNFGLNYLKHFKLYNKYKFTHDLLEEAECLQRLYALNPQNMQACECANMHDKSEFHM